MEESAANILVLFVNGQKHLSDFLPIYEQVAKKVMGKGTMAYINCQFNDSKKLCKNLKIRPNPCKLKHYKDGTSTRTMIVYSRESPSGHSRQHTLSSCETVNLPEGPSQSE